uniref:Vip1-02 n=1 Tax=Bacillus thuringiensis TaxID=1428 RepID=A0A139ZL18_BACTU|nr:binary toxin-like calcium binding domain-containing protein [Bacillus thuringiensis]AJR20766.1 Vip1-02 [Bacillus thuringiensis]AOB42271.1 Vip1-02 [Bacillus thuringiensis]
MKKQIVSVVACTVLAPMFLHGNGNTVYADNKTKQISPTLEDQQKEMDRKGLLGYYYKEKDFNNLILFAPTRENTLRYDQQTANALLDKKQQNYQSIRWVGQLQSKETGDFTFHLSEDEYAMIELNGKVISNKGKEKQVVHLEKGQLVPIKIEYQADKPIDMDSETFKNLKLFKVDAQQKSHQIQLDELRNPEFNKKETQEFLKKAAASNLFTQKVKSTKDEDDDSGGDSIPDRLEENGYTIQNKVAVPWDGSLASKGYTKFVSNPLDTHTVGDPHTDYEKAARDLDLSNAKETFNPLVAAFPSVNVSMEKVILSPNENLSNSVESHSSTNWSYTNTEGASVEAGIGPKGLSFGVSANYQHSETVGHEWGTSTGNTSQFNTASAGYLNANVRYNNVGTGAIYDVKPTTSFVLNKDTIATITAKSNTTALSISPGDSYPKKGQNGIAITSMDDFNSHPITLNKQQVGQLLNNIPIMLETDQTDGTYRVRDAHGNIVKGGQWNGVTQQIKAKTASIIIDDGTRVAEKRVAAKDYTYPEDKTPELTLKDALKLSYPDQIKETEGLLYYNDKPIYESSVMTYLDENTAKEVKKQINDTTGKFKDVQHLYDVKLTPKMNFTIKMAVLYDGAEGGASSKSIGTWYNANYVNGGNTGKTQFQSKHSSAYVVLSSEAKKKLTQNTNYYLSMYMKADSNIEPTIEVASEKSTITSKKVKLNNQDYQRVDILAKNSESNPIDKIYIKGNGTTNVYWDDVTITEISAMKPKDFSNDDIKVKYNDYSEKLDTWDMRLDNVVFKNITPFQNYVTKYRVKYVGTIPAWSFDKTLNSYELNSDGSLMVNILEYNDGRGIDLNSPSKNVTIYAITDDGREIEVYHKVGSYS